MRLVAVTAAVTGLAGLAAGQSLISAKSGLIHYVEGQVLLDGERVELKSGIFPHMREESRLRTDFGRAEVLLTPGAFLRVAENSEVRMISNRLSDTRLEVVSGSVLLECAELLKDNAVGLAFRDATIELRKDGVYRLDTEPARLRVYDGEAAVAQGGQVVPVKKGRALAFDGTLVAEKFNTKTGDPFFRWAGRRAENLAIANISAAKSIRDSGYAWDMSGWRWNPYFAMFTFIPMRGAYDSFWGYRFWSPREVYAVFVPVRSPRVATGGWEAGGRTYNPNLGYSTVRPTSAGTSGTIATSGAPTAAPAASSTPIQRESGRAGGRGR
jgi:hypothetical protein